MGNFKALYIHLCSQNIDQLKHVQVGCHWPQLQELHDHLRDPWLHWCEEVSGLNVLWDQVLCAKKVKGQSLLRDISDVRVEGFALLWGEVRER